MKPTPPASIETLVASFIPPACREHVLGDLCERYQNPRQYLADAARTIPLVVVSRIRRTSNAQMLLMEAFAVYISFLAAAWWLAGTPFLYGQSGFLRLAIPSVASLVGLVMAGAYVDLRPMVRAACGVGFGFLPEIVLWIVRPDLTVPSWIMMTGAALSFTMVCAVAVFFLEIFAGRSAVPAGDIPGKVRELQSGIRRKNLELGASVLILVFLGWSSLITHELSRRVAGGFILADALYVGYQVYKRRPSRAIPQDAAPGLLVEFYRAELQRRLVVLREIWWWYIGPFVGALLMYVLWVPFAYMDRPQVWVNILPFLTLSLLWGFGMGKMTERAARKLQEEIDELN
jgi:hypothetical protein